MREFLRLFIPAFVAPFALVWAAWLLTGFSFQVKDAFNSAPFWIISVFWWFVTTCVIASYVDEKTRGEW